MTFRKRLLVVTLAVGGGVLAFQPLMRFRMESRLSEILGGKVKIGSSKISLLEGVIALEDIVVTSPNSLEPTKVPHAALRFDWDSFLYRNLKIDHLVATEMSWNVSEPDGAQVPTAILMGLPPEPEAETLPQKTVHGVESVVKPIKLMVNSEASKQSTTHQDISSRIKLLSERITEASPNGGVINVLRQERFVVDEAIRERNEILQAIAEDRNHRKDSEKDFATKKQSASKELLNYFDSNLETTVGDVHATTIRIARDSVAKEWNAIRPILHAAIETLSTLENNSNSFSSLNRNEIALANESQRTSISTIPSRFTRLETGKLRGVASLANSTALMLPNAVEFELKVNRLSSDPKLTSVPPSLLWTLQSNSTDSPSTRLVCSAERVALPQSDASQIQLTIERTVGSTTESIIRVQQANNGWSSTMSIAPSLSTESETASENDSGLLLGPVPTAKKISAKLVGTTSVSGNDQPLSGLAIEVDEPSLQSLEDELVQQKKNELNKSRAEYEIRGSQQLRTEIMGLSTRWDQLGDEHARMHNVWKANLAELNQQIQQLEAIYKRTSRASNNTPTF